MRRTSRIIKGTKAYLKREVLEHRERSEAPNLSAISLKPIEHSLERRCTESTINSGFYIVLITFTQALRAIVKGISERFVDAFEGVTASHEDLGEWTW